MNPKPLKLILCLPGRMWVLPGDILLGRVCPPQRTPGFRVGDSSSKDSGQA